MAVAEVRAQPPAIMFMYWGRRGLTQFSLEVGRAARLNSNFTTTLSISRNNEDFEAFEELGLPLLAVDTFQSNAGALAAAWRIPLLRRQVAARIRRDRIKQVIDLIPHVWSSLMIPAIHAAGAGYAPIIHDFVSHPGDHRTAWVKALIDRPMRQADVVLTLSASVSDRLLAAGNIPRHKLVTLFHPDLEFGAIKAVDRPKPGAPLRLLFFGRIMPYKGLPLFLDAVDLLRAEGLPVEVGVFGEGALGRSAERLAAMKAEVVNRWLSNAEIAALLPRYHAMVLAHTAASQSGVAATALGAGLPVVATPVGGLTEQIIDGQTGAIAGEVSAPALAAAAKRLLLDPVFYRSVHDQILQSRDRRSVGRFVEDCVNSVVHHAG